MEIELSLTRSLASKLNLKLVSTENANPHINHFYMDIVSKNRQQNILLFNTYNSWISPLSIKDFRKDPLKAIKESLSRYLKNEELKEYIVDKYVNSITSVKLSLTNNTSIVARMSTKKKDIHFFYDRYYDAPDLFELLSDIKLNIHVVSNYLSGAYMDYFSPYIEMHAYLINKYVDKKIEDRDHSRYYSVKDEEFTYLPSPRDFRNMDKDDVESLVRKMFPNHTYDIYTYQITELIKNNPNPTIEDYFDMLHSTTEFGNEVDVRKINNNLIFLKLDKNLYGLYCECFNRTYNNRLPLDNNLYIE